MKKSASPILHRPPPIAPWFDNRHQAILCGGRGRGRGRRHVTPQEHNPTEQRPRRVSHPTLTALVEAEVSCIALEPAATIPDAL